MRNYSLRSMLNEDLSKRNRGMSGDKTRVGGAAGQYVCVGVFTQAGFTAQSNATSSHKPDVAVKIGSKTHYVEAKSGNARFDLGGKSVADKLAESSAFYMCDSSIKKHVIICFNKKFYDACKKKKITGLIDMSKNNAGRKLVEKYVSSNNNARGDHTVYVTKLMKVDAVKKALKGGAIDTDASASGIQLTVQAEMAKSYQAERREMLEKHVTPSASQIEKLQLGMIGRKSTFPGCTVKNKACSYPFLPTMGERGKKALAISKKKRTGYKSVTFKSAKKSKKTYYYDPGSFTGSSGNSDSDKERRGEAACAYVYFVETEYDALLAAYKSAQKKGTLSILDPDTSIIDSAENEAQDNDADVAALDATEPAVKIRSDALIGTDYDLSMLPEENFASLIEIIQDPKEKPHVVSVAVLQQIINMDNPGATSLKGYKLQIDGVERTAYGWRGGANKDMLIQCITDPGGMSWSLIGTDIDSDWWSSNVITTVKENLDESGGDDTSGMPTSRSAIYKAIQEYPNFMTIYSANLKKWSKINGKKRTFSQLKKGELELLWNLCYSSGDSGSDNQSQNRIQSNNNITGAEVDAILDAQYMGREDFLDYFETDDFDTGYNVMVNEDGVDMTREQCSEILKFLGGTPGSKGASPLGGKSYLGFNSLDTNAQSIVNKWVSGGTGRTKTSFKKLAEPFNKYDDEDFRLAMEFKYSIGRLLLEAASEDDWDLSLMYTLAYHDGDLESDPEALAELRNDRGFRMMMSEVE